MVSRLDYSNAVTTNSISVPAIASREATASVNIPSGMTMAIGGLMNTEDTRTVTRIPLLSNIPILGELFKHNSVSRDKREIIILITPRLVNETTKASMSEKMHDVYNEGRKDDAQQKQVDLNQAPEQKTEEIKPDDSVLGKYLNRNVLPKEKSTK